MKNICYKKIIYGLSLSFCLTTIIGCSDTLTFSDESEIASDQYLLTADELDAYIVNYYVSTSNYSSTDVTYGGRLPSHYGSGGESFYKDDLATDDAVARSGNSRYIEDNWTVPSSGGMWNFKDIRAINYFLVNATANYAAGKITGTDSYIKHHIGEGYFLRALQYFYRLRNLGDFPIVKTVLNDDWTELTEASERQPRNEVARFIISDLDSAINYLQTSAPSGGTTRLTRNCAYLLKARVALFEATWEKYFAGTAFVPNGTGWPGADKSYNADYSFPSGSADAEVKYFLKEAMDASAEVADNVSLTTNSFVDRQSESTTQNPYYYMFATQDPSSYSEVLLWRQYNSSISHWFNRFITNGGNRGWTHQMEHCFLMQNGLPVYASGSGYAGDSTIAATKINRDWRWKLFMKAPGEVKTVDNISVPDTFALAPYVYVSNSTNGNSTSTGYIMGKGYSQDDDMNGSGNDYTAAVIFRAAEAYLIYMEASYLYNGTIDSKADTYWRALRVRAGVDEDYTKTIAATDMTQEAKYDWGAYSGGELIDATLYNIRRERRCELMEEGFRYMDLCRWRAMDQLSGYQLEGARIWGSKMKAIYTAAGIDLSDYVGTTVSAESLSEYQRPLQAVSSNNSYYDGLSFYLAHYLYPIAVSHFLETASDGTTISDSPIYQNPGWGTVSGEGADYTYDGY